MERDNDQERTIYMLWNFGEKGVNYITKKLEETYGERAYSRATVARRLAELNRPYREAERKAEDRRRDTLDKRLKEMKEAITKNPELRKFYPVAILDILDDLV